jgi:DNA anti-recombination protein RmuC
MPNETTNDEIIEAIGIFSNDVKAKFEGINTQFAEIKENFGQVFKRLDKIEGRVSKVETTIATVETTMVTKDHMDDTIKHLKTGSSLDLRKEDNKLTSLVSLLKNKAVISAEEAGSINSLEPFPKGC